VQDPILPDRIVRVPAVLEGLQALKRHAPLAEQNPQALMADALDFEVRTDDGVLADVPGARLRALLITLALEPGHVVPKATLVDWIWGERPPSEAANALQRLVSRLRKALPEGKDDPVFAYVPSNGTTATSYGPSMVLGELAVHSPTIEMKPQQP
jgi:DNA-binding response OmpR family regulator